MRRQTLLVSAWMTGLAGVLAGAALIALSLLLHRLGDLGTCYPRVT